MGVHDTTVYLDDFKLTDIIEKFDRVLLSISVSDFCQISEKCEFRIQCVEYPRSNISLFPKSLVLENISSSEVDIRDCPVTNVREH